MVPNSWGKEVKESYDFDVTKADKLFDFLLEKGQTKLPANYVILGGIPYVPLKNIKMPCVPLKKFSGLQRHCSNFFMPSMPLPSIWALTPSNCRCEKTKIPLSLNMLLIFFEHLNDFK